MNKLIYKGSLEELKAVVKQAKVKGKWSDENKFDRFTSNNGLILNFWQSTGSVNFQGQLNSGEKAVIQRILSMENRGKCKTCKYWDRYDALGKGKCKINPPMGEPTTPYRAYWPLTKPDDWCAKHEKNQ